MTAAAATVPAVALSNAMRARLAKVARRHRDLEQERNETIVAASDEGGSLREIADAVGLSHVAIMKIIRKTRRPT